MQKEIKFRATAIKYPGQEPTAIEWWEVWVPVYFQDKKLNERAFNNDTVAY